MIISHKHKFIFVHLGRTGGRSLTVALARHCGEDDIITRVEDIERNSAGYRRHLSAREIRKKIGEDRFSEYFKFTIERNPWEKMLSRYRSYLRQARYRGYKKLPRLLTGRDLSFRNWFELRVWQGRTVGLGHYKLLSHYDDYMEDDRMLVDFIGRQENLQEHVDMIADRLSLKMEPLPNIGHLGTARDKPYTEMFDERMCRIVDKVFEREHDLLEYRFGEPFPTNAIIRPNE